MIEVNKDNFEQEVLKADGLVVVDFWSEKCEPCKALMPSVHELAEKNAGRAKFCSLNIAGNKGRHQSEGFRFVAFIRTEKRYELTMILLLKMLRQN